MSDSPNAPLPEPPEDLEEWIMEKPEEVRAYLMAVRAGKMLTINYVVGGVTKKAPILFSGKDASITLNIS